MSFNQIGFGTARAGVVVLAIALSAACVTDDEAIESESFEVTCAGMPAYAPGSYAGGARVRHLGRGFECRPFPASGWCGIGGPYEPGVGWAWAAAWIDLGTCDGGGTPDAGVPDAGAPDAGRPDAGPTTTVCAGRAPVVQPGAPVADNVALRETVRHDLVLVTGTAASSATAVVIGVGGQARSWPVVAGRWKALVPLATGCNDISLRTGTATAETALSYQPQSNPRRVRLVYLITADGDGRFDTPAGEPNDLGSAIARVRLAGRMLQSFTAEKERAQGFGRRTFRLETDSSGEPVVQVFRSNLTTAQAHAMGGGDLWWHWYQELRLGETEDVKVLGIMGMSHWDPVAGRAVAHAALGGGHLAIFGSTGLHTWAASLDQVVARFTDERRIDTAILHDDSNDRRTYWANYATGLGAAMHEVGHTLSLPHPVDSSTVMGRGFDHINRAFMMREAPNHREGGISPIQPSDERGWDRSHAVRLRYHRFLALDNVSYDVNDAPSMMVTPTALAISSAAGIRHVEYMVDGMSQHHDEYLGAAPTYVEVSLASVRQRFPLATEVEVTTIDDDGNINGIKFTP